MGKNIDNPKVIDWINAFLCRYRVPNDRDQIYICGVNDQRNRNGSLKISFSTAQQLYLSKEYLNERFEDYYEEIHRGFLKAVKGYEDPDSLKQYLTFDLIVPLDRNLSKSFYTGLGEVIVQQNKLDNDYMFDYMGLGIARDDTVYDYKYFDESPYFIDQPVFIVSATFVFNPDNPILQQLANDKMFEDIVAIGDKLRRVYVLELGQHAIRNDCMNFIRL